MQNVPESRSPAFCIFRFSIFVLSSCIFAAGLARAAPATLPAEPPSGIDKPLWARMKAVDAKAGQIVDLTADFEQHKYTPLLKKPMTSTGSVRAKDAAMLWDTRAPEPTMMRVDEKEVSLYYPNQKTIEIYPIAGQLSAMASSPVPRLAVLLEHFKFEPATDKDVGEEDARDRLVLRLTPVDDALREHVDHVIVLIDESHGFILTFNLIDADGERTVIRFSHVKINTNLDDARLRLSIPAGVKTVRPLEKLGPGPSDAKAAPQK